LPCKRRLTWPNGSIATIYNDTESDHLHGPQHDAQVCTTTTPRPIALLKELMKDPGTVVTRGSTFDNSGNLSEKFLESIRRKYEDTRLGRQELNAELLEDIEGALWKRSLVDALRVQVHDLPPLKRIVVAIDPNASSEENSNECGIICPGLGTDSHGYVLDDVSGVIAPHEWATTAISLLRERMGDRIIAETNNGGEMVEHTLRTVDPSIPFSAV
jgi:phage terminase large subunit-like protein